VIPVKIRFFLLFNTIPEDYKNLLNGGWNCINILSKRRGLGDARIGGLVDSKIGRLEDWRIGGFGDWRIRRLEDWRIRGFEDSGKRGRWRCWVVGLKWKMAGLLWGLEEHPGFSRPATTG
jgi:hypothetical protein